MACATYRVDPIETEMRMSKLIPVFLSIFLLLLSYGFVYAEAPNIPPNLQHQLDRLIALPKSVSTQGEMDKQVDEILRDIFDASLASKVMLTDRLQQIKKEPRWPSELRLQVEFAKIFQAKIAKLLWHFRPMLKGIEKIELKSLALTDPLRGRITAQMVWADGDRPELFIDVTRASENDSWKLYEIWYKKVGDGSFLAFQLSDIRRILERNPDFGKFLEELKKAIK